MSGCSGGWWSSHGASIVFWEGLAKCAQRAGFGGPVERIMSCDDLPYHAEACGSYADASVVAF